MDFSLTTTDGLARRGVLHFERGEVQTPAFMPVGTYGTVKGMTPEDVRATGAHILLGNTFHLWSVNEDPYGEGWMVKIKIADASELDGLMDAAAYEAMLG